MLNQADPCVETLVQETGEHVILTAGELHLEVSTNDPHASARAILTLRALSHSAASRTFVIASLASRSLCRLPSFPSERPPSLVWVSTLPSSRVVSSLTPAFTDMAPPKTADQPRGTIIGSVQSGLVTFTLRAVPLPEEVTAFLIANLTTLKRLQRDRRSGKAEEVESDEARGDVVEGVEPVKPEEFWPELERLLKEAGKDWAGVADQVWAFGPRRVGANMLIDRTAGAPRSYVASLHSAPSAPLLILSSRSLRRRLERQSLLPSSAVTPGPLSPTPGSPSLVASTEALSLNTAELEAQLDAPEHDTAETSRTLPDVRQLDENIDTAFQLATNRGPLCAEPVIGMAYFLEAIELHAEDLEPSVGASSRLSAVSGALADAQPSHSSLEMVERARADHFGRPGRLPQRATRLVASPPTRRLLL